jgi:hypothetical protein
LNFIQITVYTPAMILVWLVDVAVHYTVDGWMTSLLWMMHCGLDFAPR